jgi:hypothetical protein
MQRNHTTLKSTMHASFATNTQIIPIRGRTNSAQPNLQSHPMFQSSLFNDKERPAGSLSVWKERVDKNFPKIQPDDSLNANMNVDYQLMNIAWTESVSLI